MMQVEYAIEAIKLGSTAIGIQTSEGVILAVEKRITSPLMEPTTIEKVVEIDKHVGKYYLYLRSLCLPLCSCKNTLQIYKGLEKNINTP